MTNEARIAFRKIRARHLNNREKIGILANLFRNILIDFRFWPRPASTLLCSMFHGNNAAASTACNVSQRSLQRPHLTTAAASD